MGNKYLDTYRLWTFSPGCLLTTPLPSNIAQNVAPCIDPQDIFQEHIYMFASVIIAFISSCSLSCFLANQTNDLGSVSAMLCCLNCIH